MVTWSWKKDFQKFFSKNFFQKSFFSNFVFSNFFSKKCFFPEFFFILLFKIIFDQFFFAAEINLRPGVHCILFLFMLISHWPQKANTREFFSPIYEVQFSTFPGGDPKRGKKWRFVAISKPGAKISVP